MKDNCFFDTSIIIYCYTSSEPDKRKKALALIDQHSYISLQVIHEFSNVIKRKFNQSSPEILNALKELTQSFTVYQNNIETAIRVVELSGKLQYTFYDSLIIAAALNAGCKKLYSEDLHHKHVIDKQLTILNPFL